MMCVPVMSRHAVLVLTSAISILQSARALLQRITMLQATAARRTYGSSTWRAACVPRREREPSTGECGAVTDWRGCVSAAQMFCWGQASCQGASRSKGMILPLIEPDARRCRPVCDARLLDEQQGEAVAAQVRSGRHFRDGWQQRVGHCEPHLRQVRTASPLALQSMTLTRCVTDTAAATSGAATRRLQMLPSVIHSAAAASWRR